MATILPNTNLKVHEIRDTLNKYGGKTDNDLSSLFKASANINKWSRKKPVSYPKPCGMTDYDYYFTNYGLDTSYASTSAVAKTLLEAAMAGTDFYPHILPYGTEGSPYRIEDFKGYNPDAKAPYTVECPGTLDVQAFPANLPFTMWVNQSAEIKITDLAAFDNLLGSTDAHMGVLWTKGDGVYYLFNSAKGDDITQDVALNLTVPGEGTYHFLGVFTNYDMEYGNVDVTGLAETFIPIPGTYAKTVVTRVDVFGKVSVQWDALDNLYYTSGYIQGFGTSYPVFTLSFPDGSTPACSYRVGVYVRAELDGSTYGGEWYHDDEYIDHSGGDAGSKTTFVDFPGQLSLEEILGALYDPNMSVDSITVRLVIERVTGQGYLGLADNTEYNVTVS